MADMTITAKKGAVAVLVVGIVTAAVKAADAAMGDAIPDELEGALITGISGAVFSALNWWKHRKKG